MKEESGSPFLLLVGIHLLESMSIDCKKSQFSLSVSKSRVCLECLIRP